MAGDGCTGICIVSYIAHHVGIVQIVSTKMQIKSSLGPSHRLVSGKEMTTIQVRYFLFKSQVKSLHLIAYLCDKEFFYHIISQYNKLCSNAGSGDILCDITDEKLKPNCMTFH